MRLRPVQLLSGEFQWRQRVTARWQTGERSFQAVISKHGDALQLLGLDPMGRVGFVFRLEPAQGDAEPVFTVEQRPGLELPFDPKHVLLDVQRVFYPWLSGQPPSEGERSGVVDGVVVEELWRSGHLQERRFGQGGAPGELEPIVVRYTGWQSGRATPQRAVVDNTRHGYSLSIETLSEQQL